MNVIKSLKRILILILIYYGAFVFLNYLVNLYLDNKYAKWLSKKDDPNFLSKMSDFHLIINLKEIFLFFSINLFILIFLKLKLKFYIKEFWFMVTLLIMYKCITRFFN